VKNDRTVLLGYELGTGRPVEIPVRHTAVTGITQESGKTTTLEALIGRSGLRAVTFVTKRAEGAFTNGSRIPAYFREHADWMFVSSLLEAFLQQKMKFERSWIMRVCKGAQNLRDVQSNLAKAMHGARTGLDESVYFTLSEYLEALVPEIEALPYAKSLQLQPGINVIDVSEYSLHLQGLVIRSCMEWIYERESGVITLIPEAWEFVPQSHNSPAKSAAVQLIRKGAAAGNYVWLDSQDLAGVEKEIVRQCSVYILGVQREANEVRRTLLHLPAGSRKPKPEQIMQLGRGWFYASFGNELRCTYVQPAWLNDDPRRAQRYAIEKLPASFVAKPHNKTTSTKGEDGAGDRAVRDRAARPAPEPQNATETVMNQDEMLMLRAKADELDQVRNVLAREFGPEFTLSNMTTASFLAKISQRMKEPADSAPASGTADVEGIVAQVLGKLKASPEFAALHVAAEKPEISVTVQRKVIDLDGSTLKGRLAQMIAEGWFEEAKTGNAAFNELQRRGCGTAKPNVYRELDKLAEWGFVTKESEGGYKAVEGMKINIREVAA
jgi:hypothetical protein